MNALTNAIKDVKLNIPKEILNIAFLEYGVENINNQIVSLDDRILNTVIRPIVLVDCNLVGGIDMSIDLFLVDVARQPDYGYIITIDKKHTGGRSILAAYDIICNVVSVPSYPMSGGSSLNNVGINMYNNLSSHSIIHSSKLEVIGENKILLHDPGIYMISGAIRVRVENSPNMSNLPPASYPAFSKLCVLAVKAWIYNHTIIKLNQGYIYKGHELTRVTSIIEGYESAIEEYNELLVNKMRKVLFMSQSETRTRFITHLIPNNI